MKNEGRLADAFPPSAKLHSVRTNLHVVAKPHGRQANTSHPKPLALYNMVSNLRQFLADESFLAHAPHRSFRDLLFGSIGTPACAAATTPRTARRQHHPRALPKPHSLRLPSRLRHQRCANLFALIRQRQNGAEVGSIGYRINLNPWTRARRRLPHSCAARVGLEFSLLQPRYPAFNPTSRSRRNRQRRRS